MPSDNKPSKAPGEFFAELYDKWAIPVSDEPDAPMVTSLHDGLDWVQVHAPRSFFEELGRRVAAGDTQDVLKWLSVWGMARKEPDPSRCGAPTLTGSPCHCEKPCKYHRGQSARTARQQRRR